MVEGATTGLRIAVVAIAMDNGLETLDGGKIYAKQVKKVVLCMVWACCVVLCCSVSVAQGGSDVAAGMDLLDSMAALFSLFSPLCL